jgi:tripartite-type tricarboxylate transporter receptor subunit TctC
MKKLLITILLVMLAFPSFLLFAEGQSEGAAPEFPKKPIKVLVYLAPGGSGDVLARKFTDVASKYTDATFVVENKPGAGGIVALEYARKLPNDGYTLIYMTKSVISKLVTAGSDIDPLEFDWIGNLQIDPECVITNQANGIVSWEEVVADAEKKNGEQLWLGPAAGGLDHVTAQAIWEKAGIQAKWVPFDSGGKAKAALLGQQGVVYVGNPGEIIGKPDFRVAAICYSERMAQFPDVPTFKELGVSGLENEIMWRGFAVNKDTPDNIIAWYEDLFEKVTNDPEWKKTYEPQGVKLVNQKKDVFNDLVEADYEAYMKAAANQ